MLLVIVIITTGLTNNNGRGDVSLSHFWRTLEMSLINCKINLILTWSVKCVIASHTAANQATKFAITDTKLYVLVATLSNSDNAKLLQQLK